MFHVERSHRLIHFSSAVSQSQDPRLLLDAGLDELSVQATEQQIDSLTDLSLLLFEWSKSINLTGHRTVSEIVRRLVLDAVALAVHVPAVSSLADIGSGAGFPGMPIAILRPETRVALVDSRERRNHFQRHAVRILNLKNVQPILGRAEELEGPVCSAAIAQAIAPRDALALLLRWVKPNGLLLFPGAEHAPTPPTDPAVVVEDRVRYQVPCGGPTRTLWIARKIAV